MRRRADGWGATADPDRKRARQRSDCRAQTPRKEPPGSNSDAKHSARQRLRLIDHQVRNATACHLAAMDLARYYRGGLLDVRLGELLARETWAA